MNGGTIHNLWREDKVRIGKLYEQLLIEREEKEEILENYNYEKEKFEQIIDLLQSQKYNNERVEAAKSQLDNYSKTERNDPESLEKVPFPDCLRSDSKEEAKTPDQNNYNFHSPTPWNRRSEFASPVQYFDKVIKDIKVMKNELTKIHQEQARQFALASPLSTVSNNYYKNGMLSPDQSAKNTESVSNTGMKKNHEMIQGELKYKSKF